MGSGDGGRAELEGDIVEKVRGRRGSAEEKGGDMVEGREWKGKKGKQ